MKKIVLLLSFAFYFNFSSAQYANNFASYKSVINEFYTKYDYSSVSENSFHKFEKHKDGWHVVFYDYNDQTKINADFLLWDKSKNAFVKINLPDEKGNGIEKNSAEIVNLLKSYDTLYFNHFPLYGYRGWDLETIELLKDVTNLKDTLTYALARAYSEYASNLLNDNLQTGDKSRQFIFAEGTSELSDEQLITYRFYRHKAIDHFYKTYLLNSKFETLVGDILVKYSNEFITSFYDLLIYKNEAEANKELSDKLYTPFTIAMAKNFLTSCDSNAVLFSYGDNDTYPLLYVQSKLNFRRDVLVANTSLMNTSYYINFLRKKVFESKPFDISFEKEEYENGNLDYVLLDKSDSNSTFDISQIHAWLNNSENKKSQLSNIYNIPTPLFALNVLNSNAFAESEKPNAEVATFESVMKWNVTGSYLSKNQVIFLDFLQMNNWQRPVYFTVSSSREIFTGLDDYLLNCGLAYRLSPFKTKKQQEATGYINSTILWNKLMVEFNWSGISNLASNEKLFVNTYRNQFFLLAKQLTLENKKQKAKEVLDACIKLFPDEVASYNVIMIKAMEEYNDIGETESSKKIMRQLFFNFKNMVVITSNKDAILQYLKVFAQYNNWNDMNDLF